MSSAGFVKTVFMEPVPVGETRGIFIRPDFNNTWVACGFHSLNLGSAITAGRLDGHTAPSVRCWEEAVAVGAGMMLLFRRRPPILGYGHTPEEPPRMLMATQARRWTLDEMHALPEDGNKYELIHGELLVTPAPAPRHEGVSTRLRDALARYATEERLGVVYVPRAVFRIGRVVEVEPDIQVRAEIDEEIDWEDQPLPILVAEVLSHGTRRTDLTKKRDVYVSADIEYWTVDPDTRTVTIHRPRGDPVTVTTELQWHPNGAQVPFQLDLRSLFR